MDACSKNPVNLKSWKAGAVADLDRVAARHYWGRAMMGIGWIHLLAFLWCEQMFTRGILRNEYYLATWAVELVAVLALMKWVAGAGWRRSTPLADVIFKVWVTFLILSFNLASLNKLSGLDHDWFKPPLATLSTFGFATMAYLINPRFFILAVQMYFTGLLMVTNPRHSYLIYGVSWWLALQAIGITLERRRIAFAHEGSKPRTSLKNGALAAALTGRDHQAPEWAS